MDGERARGHNLSADSASDGPRNRRNSDEQHAAFAAAGAASTPAATVQEKGTKFGRGNGRSTGGGEAEVDQGNVADSEVGIAAL
ncbi:hypothetical protein E2562_015670 [Oryza meyeriana var. granulata]|uniref:DUF834 domain-containing protein n=1 Tax=Oryza meyeriana var. granulata TaxID=110450 RepID=A0A6G1D461_9ORYZ|nr:hypothetical protein E2562_015670 [Oryza meyeriana var. granulata]